MIFWPPTLDGCVGTKKGGVLMSVYFWSDT
jgi:hypothetical protein